MKLNTLFVVGVCASALLASCNPVKTGNERQLANNNTTLIDGDAYQFFQKVSARAVYEHDQAAYVAQVATSSQAKQVAAKAEEVYGALIPVLDSLATVNQVDFPIKGAAKFDAASLDSTFSDEAYVQHVQEETAIVKGQIERMAHDTDKGLRAFAHQYQESVNELFTLAGGKAEAHGHH